MIDRPTPATRNELGNVIRGWPRWMLVSKKHKLCSSWCIYSSIYTLTCNYSYFFLLHFHQGIAPQRVEVIVLLCVRRFPEVEGSADTFSPRKFQLKTRQEVKLSGTQWHSDTKASVRTMDFASNACQVSLPQPKACRWDIDISYLSLYIYIYIYNRYNEIHLV